MLCRLDAGRLDFATVRPLLMLAVDALLIALWPLRALGRLLFAPRTPLFVELVLKGPLAYRDPAKRRLQLLRRGRRGPSLDRLRRLADRIRTSDRCLGLLL